MIGISCFIKFTLCRLCSRPCGTYSGAESYARPAFGVWFSIWFQAMCAPPRLIRDRTVPDEGDLPITARLPPAPLQTAGGTVPVDDGGGPEDLSVWDGSKGSYSSGTFAALARGAPCLSVRERNPFAERKATMGCYPRNASSERCPFFCEHSGRIGCLPIRKRPWSVPDSHATLRRSGTRFNSWRGHFFSPFPASVSGARRSSKPQGRVRFPGGGLWPFVVLGV